MSLKLFYMVGALGIVIAGILTHVGERKPLVLVIPCMIAAAVIMFVIGQWHKKHGGLK